jgi:hypothetical protein
VGLVADQNAAEVVAGLRVERLEERAEVGVSLRRPASRRSVSTALATATLRSRSPPASGST